MRYTPERVYLLLSRDTVLRAVRGCRIFVHVWNAYPGARPDYACECICLTQSATELPHLDEATHCTGRERDPQYLANHFAARHVVSHGCPLSFLELIARLGQVASTSVRWEKRGRVYALGGDFVLRPRVVQNGTPRRNAARHPLSTVC